MRQVADQLTRDGLLDERLLVYFKRAQSQLMKIIERASPSGPFYTYRVRQMRAIETVIRRMELQTKDWAEKEIPRLVYAGEEEAKAVIKTFKELQYMPKYQILMILFIE
jgi:hypothetical protein